MNQPMLDPFAVALGLAAIIVGPKLAPHLAAYSLILFAWFGGVLVGVYRREPAASRMGTAVFVLVTLILTVGVTVPAADALANYIGATATVLLFPVAFLIPCVGDNWVDAARWAWRLVAARFERPQQGGQ